ncbi:MAG: ATP-binding protein, partial [Stenotrophobium sp.]
ADMRRAEALLRCAQEGLTNALRHADAATVRVSLRQEAAGVVLTVEDDGRGRVAQVRAGNGLRGIRERLEEAGGHLELRDRAPSGLVLRTILPAAKPAAGAANVQTRAESAHYCLLKAAAAALQANHGHAGQSAG